MPKRNLVEAINRGLMEEMERDPAVVILGEDVGREGGGFLAPAMDQIMSHISRIRPRSRGRFTSPLVIRSPFGGGIHAPEHHSDSPEAILAHIPGIKVVIPSTPYEAKGLLLSSIRDPDPVIFLEPNRISRPTRAEVPKGDYPT